ncbi:MAG: AroM family protein [Chloroflexi bacterium]|nr:AroM family protein [Chloroflexota bacterium]
MLGLVTLGTTPRKDFEDLFCEYVPGIPLQMRGALDGLSAEEIDALEAQPGNYPALVGVNGVTREFELTALQPLLAKHVRELADEGARAVVILGAPDFPEFDCDVPVIRPGRIMPAVAGAIAKTRRIGIVTPIEGQAPAALAKWEADGFSVKIAWCSPYRDDQLEAAAAQLTDADLEVVVLDGMSFNSQMRDRFARISGRPTLLVQTLVARIAGELVGA